jgi:RNA polymerase sigma-70 factor (ECF subfamily)
LAHRSAIYNYVLRMVANDSDAEDLTVTAFEKALKAWDRRPAKVEEIRPWLFRIATNCSIDELRRRQRIQWRPWDPVINLFHRNQVAKDDPEAEVMRQETVELMRAALDKLPPHYRAALLLRESQGMSAEEIGHALGISRDAAKVTMYRAREKLRSIYLQLGGEPPNRNGKVTKQAPVRSNISNKGDQVGSEPR